MRWLYGIVILFSLLTIYLTYVEYKKNVQLKKVFTIVLVMYSLVIIFLVIQFLL